MYSLAVQRDFVAQHFLIGGDWGAENSLHSHHYLLELQLEGDALDRHGYLVDIVNVEQALNMLITGFRDKTLNDLPQFTGLNPSIEHFTRIAAEQLASAVAAPNLTALTVRIWENQIAWAAYRMALRT
jgi:6-pyruvoyltetrahydropterin/6-carboxytetrahydropterin synthase